MDVNRRHFKNLKLEQFGIERKKSWQTRICLQRVLRAAPEKVYRAFLDADALAKWLPPNGFTGKVHHLEPRVGGTHKMLFTNFTTGQSHSFGGDYLELTLTSGFATRTSSTT